MAKRFILFKIKKKNARRASVHLIYPDMNKSISSEPYNRNVLYNRYIGNDGCNVLDTIKWIQMHLYDKYTEDWSIDSNILSVLHYFAKQSTVVKTHEKTAPKCTECGDNIEHDDIKTFNNKVYCSECYDKNFVKCVDCGEWHDYDESVELEHGLVCDTCRGNYFTCDHCGDIHNNDQCIYADEMSLCEICYEDHYTRCDSCECIVHCDDIYDGLCNYCYENEESEAPRESQNIHDYSYTPVFNLHKLQYENTVYMGIELEVEHNEYSQLAEEFTEWLESKGHNNKFYLKHDSSINGFEIVTHPITTQYRHKSINWHEILKWLQKKGSRSFTGNRAGLHIHVNQDHFKPKDLAKMRRFVSINFEQLHIFSQRHGNLQWSRNEHYGYDDMKRDILQNTMKENHDRLCALNLMTGAKPTFEFRLFRGTLFWDRFIATIQFVDAISYYVKDMGLDFSWGAFMTWCKQVNRYGHFVKYITKKEIV